MKKILLDIRCYIFNLHHWVDEGWINWFEENGIDVCDYCGRRRKK